MRKSLFGSVAAVIILAMFTLTACNTKIKVSYDYEVSDYIELGNYKQLTAEVDVTSIENRLIEERINNERKQFITYSEVQRAAQEEDRITFSYSGSVGGLPVAQFSGSDYQMVLGSDTFPVAVTGFTENLYGMKPGDTKVVTLQFSENYSDETYAGARIVFDVSVSAVEQPNIPMITDAYVKEHFSYNTVEEYREYAKEQVQSAIDDETKAAKEEAVLSQLQNQCTIKGYPETLMEERRQELDESINFYALMQNLSNDEYCQKNYNMSFDEYVEKSVAQELVFLAIIEKENICVTEYEYKGDLQEFAERVGYSSKDTLLESFSKDEIVKGMLLQKAQDFVMDNAVIITK